MKLLPQPTAQEIEHLDKLKLVSKTHLPPLKQVSVEAKCTKYAKMGDPQKIHPVTDVEGRPTAPLVPNGSSKISERADPVQHNYAPFRRTIPPAVAKPPKKRSCCCKCICWTTSLLILLLVVIATAAGTLYLVFQPKVPEYSVDRLKISDLRLNLDMSLYAKFDVKITAYNPNDKIGIFYDKGSHLSVWYSNTKLCQGSLPKFYQGHRNRTMLNVTLTGQTQYGSTLMAALQEQQQTGRIPLDLKVDVPVSIKLGKLKLRKVRIFGRCMLVVDSLSANNKISIKASSCKFRLKL
ncbi:hypothetical protein RJ640_001972 [Escallonia rubra]|uniref:Late embryogenesis abundant protein LEA-2 subgroup domain-containing protein n=1 Tax=Escallonia rubra TaxID=112253 RepID=A0AA88UVI5_9ASTE|nr:hypothetical protein RJ640_001972 [Escallonia rubra]